jgi:hypothetical protein
MDESGKSPKSDRGFVIVTVIVVAMARGQSCRMDISRE